MYSKSHLAISAVLGLSLAVWFEMGPVRGALVVGYTALLGTAIDLDHFVIARLRTGDWSSLRFALSNPRAGLLEQDRIFAEGEVGARARLVSHVAIGSLLVAVVWTVDPFLALVSGMVIGVHLACDVVHDVRSESGGPQRS